MAAEGSEPTETHVRFSQVCGEVGLPRNATKQLVGAMGGGIQGGELNGNLGTIKVGRDKLQNFQAISLALLAQAQVTEYQVRHWIGKAALIATFSRPLFSILREIFELLEKCKQHGQSLRGEVIDEIICFMGLSVQAQSELRSEVSEVISVDASPSGGGSAAATKIKTKSWCRKSWTPRSPAGAAAQISET